MARERYLVNAGEDTIHANEIKPETPKEKRENWWFYHKGHLIVGLLVAVAVVYMVWSVVSKVEPDYTVALMTSYTVPETGADELERCIAAYADDRNGDGKIKVEVQMYTLSPELKNTVTQAQQMQAEIARFAADATLNESMIYLHDSGAFDTMKDDFQGFFQYNDGRAMPEDAVDFENAMRPWSDFAGLAQFTPEVGEDDLFTAENLTTLYEKLRVSFRAKENTSIEKSEEDVAYYQASQELYQRLLDGEKPE